LKRLPVPVSKLQSELLRLLASRRDPESFVAGGVAINRTGPRISRDIDIFHDREERVATTALEDAQILSDAGYAVSWLRQQPAIYSAAIASTTEETKLEWVADSDFRFFPAVKDEEFGYVLHMADLAVNKVMAAAGRREARDLVDLVTVHEQFLPLGAIVWAAVETAPGFTPEGLIAEIRRNARYPAQAFAELDALPPIDPVVVMRKLRAALDEAEEFVMAMPSEKAGTLFLKDGHPVQPDPSALDQTVEHRGQRRGHWPTSPEIARAMLERYTPKPHGTDGQDNCS
jgi:hypothetical protein